MADFVTLRSASSQFLPSTSLQAFSDYADQELSNRNSSSVSNDGVLLEYETLALRVEPTNVEIDNSTFDDRTVFVVDSANRPGTLVEVVQCLTELGLSVIRARISSDGGWFVDDFHVTESDGRKVTDQTKLRHIERLLSIESLAEVERAPINQQDEHTQLSTVFEISGQDKPGLLADILQLLTNNGCDVRSAAVWTSRYGRVACVISVLEGAGTTPASTSNAANPADRQTATEPNRSALGRPVDSEEKRRRLKELILNKLPHVSTRPDEPHGVVNVLRIKGLIHYERRLHQLMLRDEEARWQYLQQGNQSEAHATAEQSSLPSLLQRVSLNSPMANSHAHMGTGPLPMPNGHAHIGNGPLSMPNSHAHMGNGALPMPNGHAYTGNGSLAMPNGHASTADGSGFLTTNSTEIGRSFASTPSTDEAALLVSKKYGKPGILLTPCWHLNYWTVNIKCKDRSKLFFDTVCTLADLNYDVFHASVDIENDISSQFYYIRPRSQGNREMVWDEVEVAKLRYLLQSSIERRFPPGLKLHVQNGNRDCLVTLTQALKQNDFTVTRAKVRAYSDTESHTLYIMQANGGVPEWPKIKRVCEQIGGRLLPGRMGDSAVVKEAAESGQKCAFCFEHFSSPNQMGRSP